MSHGKHSVIRDNHNFLIHAYIITDKKCFESTIVISITNNGIYFCGLIVSFYYGYQPLDSINKSLEWYDN